MKPLFISFAISLLILQACKSKTEAAPDFELQYMPLEVGRFIMYSVDSTVYDKFKNEKRTFLFQIKDKVVSTFSDNTAQTFFRIARYKRRQDSTGVFLDSTFIIKKVMAAAIINNGLQVIDDNQKYVTFIFPPEIDKEWNGNTYNNLGVQTYFFNNVSTSITLNNVVYSNVYQVVEVKSNPEIKIYKKYNYTTYAKNIGIIEKYIMDIASQKNLNLPIESRIEEGLIYHQKIISYGKE
jgi:hypothetical protein